jgi:hypothetical protein
MENAWLAAFWAIRPAARGPDPRFSPAIQTHCRESNSLIMERASPWSQSAMPTLLGSPAGATVPRMGIKDDHVSSSISKSQRRLRDLKET